MLRGQVIDHNEDIEKVKVDDGRGKYQLPLAPTEEVRR